MNCRNRGQIAAFDNEVFLGACQAVILTGINDASDHWHRGCGRDSVFKNRHLSVIRKHHDIIRSRALDVTPKTVGVGVSDDAGFATPDDLKALTELGEGVLDRAADRARADVGGE